MQRTLPATTVLCWLDVCRLAGGMQPSNPEQAAALRRRKSPQRRAGGQHR